ncbi:universal stress protein, partial [Acinetobacter baumannii]|uniref:universal stress protein n=1 Tax=Acinetobacter baumannii TaxID=470 RepID=UPI00287071BA
MNYRHIIVPVDGSEISLAAARQAAHIAKAFGSKLTAISLVAVDPFSGVDFYYISPVVKDYSVHDKFHRTLILSGFCLLKIAKISL